MLINKPGAEFLYNGITYHVGDVIIGSDQSEYAGLIGSILEIRDGDDKETENDTPDIYCSFEPPVLPADIAKVVQPDGFCLQRRGIGRFSGSIEKTSGYHRYSG